MASEFGIRADPAYQQKVADNKKVYRKIKERLNYYKRLGKPKTVRNVILILHRKPLWHQRLATQSDRSWESHLRR